MYFDNVVGEAPRTQQILLFVCLLAVFVKKKGLKGVKFSSCHVPLSRSAYFRIHAAEVENGDDGGVHVGGCSVC